MMTHQTSSSTRPKLLNLHLNQRRRDGLTNESIVVSIMWMVEFAAKTILELKYDKNRVKRSIAADYSYARISSN